MERKRERLPVKGAEDSGNLEQWFVKVLLDGKRERAPVEGVRGSGIPAQSSGKARGGVTKDTLGIGAGQREQAPVKGAEDSDRPPTLLDVGNGSGDVGNSENLSGKRARAPADGVANSDVPNHSAEETCRLGDLHFAPVTGRDVVKEHTQWLRPDMEEGTGTQPRKDPGASFAIDGERHVLSA